MTVVQLPIESSPYYGDPVADVASLPDSGATGELRLTLDTGTIYYWDGDTWEVNTAGAAEITLTGDVTGSGTGSFATTIGAKKVTYAKIQDVTATDKLLGRSTAGAGVVEEVTCTAAGRALLDDVTAAAQVTTLGLDNTKIASIGITVDGGGSALTAGSKGFISVPYGCSIDSWTILSDVAGSAVIDIKRSTYGDFPTTASIVGAGNKPTLSTAQKNTAAPASWTSTAITAGDILEFVVEATPSTLTRCNLTLKVTKT